MGFTYEQLQKEQGPWVAHNFGARPSSQPLRGIIEEMCFEFEVATTEDDKQDALADAVIFACDYASSVGLDFASLMSDAEIEVKALPCGDDCSRMYLIALGQLAQADLKLEQKIRMDRKFEIQRRRALVVILAYVHHWWHWDETTLLATVDKTWARVKQRDFRKNAQTGGEAS